MSDIVVSGSKKINILDKIIQNVVIMVNISKMNKAIDEHLDVIKKTERDDQKLYQEKILREIVYVKYQYDIMQRTMYELKLSYSNDITDNINSIDKTERLELQKQFLEMEYDRISRAKFKNKDEIKYMLLEVATVIAQIKQDIKDEGKNQKYNQIIKCAEEIDSKLIENTYSETCYTQLFEYLKEYVNYINDNYDIAALPNDEKEIIELVIESTIKGIDSDIDKLQYEFSLITNICKYSYRYFGIINKVFERIQSVYDDSLIRQSINIKDYINFYKEIYDIKIKTMVNDVHRNIKTEDEYLEYSKTLLDDIDELYTFMLNKAKETTSIEEVINIIDEELEKEKIEKNEANSKEPKLEEKENIEIEITEDSYVLSGQADYTELKENVPGEEEVS